MFLHSIKDWFNRRKANGEPSTERQYDPLPLNGNNDKTVDGNNNDVEPQPKKQKRPIKTVPIHQSALSTNTLKLVPVQNTTLKLIPTQSSSLKLSPIVPTTLKLIPVSTSLSTVQPPASYNHNNNDYDDIYFGSHRDWEEEIERRPSSQIERRPQGGAGADFADKFMIFDDLSDFTTFLTCLRFGVIVPGRCGDFTIQSAIPIALVKAEEILKLSADEIDDAVEDILLLNLSLPDFISKYNSKERYAQLREDLTAKALEDAERLGIENDKDIQRIVGIRWLTGINVMTNYNDIITSLVDATAGVYPSKYNKHHIFAHMKEENEKQDCIGVTKQRLGEDRVREFCRILKTNGNYFVEIFHTNEKDPIIIDTDAKRSTTMGLDNDEEERNEYKKNRYPGTTDRFVRRVKITRCKEDTLTAFVVMIRRSDDPADRITVTLHQLTHIILHSMGLGLHNHAGFRSFLDLEDGQSFEEISWLSYGDGDEEYLKKRAQHLRRKGWEDVALANTSDIEHNFGRSKVWMNSSFLTFPCSHSYNRCLSYVRVIWKCWGFISSDKTYGSGND